MKLDLNAYVSGTGNAIILPAGHEVISSAELVELRAQLRACNDELATREMCDQDALNAAMVENAALCAQVAELQAWKDAVPVRSIEKLARMSANSGDFRAVGYWLNTKAGAR